MGGVFLFFHAVDKAAKTVQAYLTFITEDRDLKLMFSQEAQALRESGFIGQETQIGFLTSFQLDFLHLQDAGWYVRILDASGVNWSMTIV